ncbi:LysR family transcriptional regulator [Lacibacterium aquatile]|uniref:LysR family transcriptional regulator n=1 Tax=Lacibacterium aquatile TaxID=1168082 RepID=A0ABW5DXU5_9PROT
MSSPLDWEHLKTLLALSRGATLSGAARALAVDQSTVTRRLSAMEARLGVRLIERNGDGIHLTAAGETAVAGARSMEAAALGVERQLSGLDARPTGTVRVTTLEMIAARVIAPALPQLAQEHPGLVLEVIADNRTLDLTRRDADLALRLGRPTEPDLKARKLATLTLGLYGSTGIDWQWPVNPGLDNRPLIVPDSSIGATPEASWLSEQGRDAKVMARLSSLTGQIAACRAGLGIACLPDVFAREEADLYRLADTGINRELWLVLHPDLSDAARVRAAADWLVRLCSSLG